MNQERKNISRRSFLRGAAKSTLAVGLAGIGSGCSQAQKGQIEMDNQKLPGDMNIVFIFSDQHRGDYLGMRGVQSQLKTPNIDSLSANGVSFANAYTGCPLCVPARPALLAGKYPSALGFDKKPLATLEGHLTLPQHLRDNGYYTGHFGKGHLIGETKEQLYGFDERDMQYLYQSREDYNREASPEIATEYLEAGSGNHGGGKRTYNCFYNKTWIPEELHFDSLVVDKTSEFITRNASRKFYVQVGIEKPHPLWFPPSRFMDEVDPDKVTIPENWRRRLENVPQRRIDRQTGDWNQPIVEHHIDTKTCKKVSTPIEQTRGWDEKQVKNAMAAYIASINYVDFQVGRVIESLKQNGLLEKTLIVYCSDHGELCFDHGMVQKHCGYESSIHVPMIFSGAGVKATGMLDDCLAEHVDLFPTFCDYLGIDKPAGLVGESLLPAMAGGEKPKKEVIYSEYFHAGNKPELTIRSLKWKYIDNGEFIPELYDMVNDLAENVNLAGNAEYAEVLAEMKKKMAVRQNA